MPRPFVAAIALLFAATAARAEPRCASSVGGGGDGDGGALEQVDPATRLAFVRAVMRDDAARAHTWTWAWAGIGGALIVGNFTVAALSPPEDRVDPIVGGVASVFLPVSVLVTPLAVMADDEALEAAIARGAGDPCADLAIAEHLFANSADDEALHAGPLSHAIAIVGNAAIALFLGVGYGHWGGALLNGGGGLVISEAQIFTQPKGVMHALDRYRQGELRLEAPETGIRIAPRVFAEPHGLAVGFTF